MEENLEVKKLSIGEKIKYFFINPGKVFAEYIDKPTFLVKFLIIAIGVIINALAESTQKSLFVQKSIERLQKMNYPQQYLETAKKSVEISYSAPMLIIMGLIGAAISIAFMSFIYWLFTRFVHGENNYADTAAVYSLAYIPQTIYALLVSVYILAAHTIPNIDAADNPTLLSSALSGINIFTLWQIVLLIIGLAKVGNISKKKAVIIVLLVTVIGIAFKMGSFAVGHSFGSMVK